jgi:hypothetical protein
MQAIRTRYHGPTNSRGSRISAKCEAGTVSVTYDDALNLAENHQAACEALLTKLGWTTPAGYKPMHAGQFDGDWFWVSATPHPEDTTRV